MSKNITFFGVTFDTKLTWKKHINNIHSSIRKRISYLKTITGKQSKCAPNTIIQIYKAYIRPLIEYDVK